MFATHVIGASWVQFWQILTTFTTQKCYYTGVGTLYSMCVELDFFLLNVQKYKFATIYYIRMSLPYKCHTFLYIHVKCQVIIIYGVK